MKRRKLNALIAIEIILTMTLYYFVFVGDAIITYATDLIEDNLLNNENASYNVEAKIITNDIFSVDGQSKRIMQLYIQDSMQDSKFNIKSNQINLKIPTEAEKVEVLSRGTYLTNGKEAKEFTEENWEYNDKKGIVSIKVENQDENFTPGENTKDTFIVNLTFAENKEFTNDLIKVGGRATLTNNQTLSSEIITLEDIEKQAEDIVNYDVNMQEELYKGKMYSHEETTFTSESKMDIRYSKISDEIKYKEKLTNYELQDGEKEINGGYKKSEVDGEEIKRIIGEKGEIIFYDQDENVIKEINNETELDETGKIKIEYENLKELTVEIKNAENEGIIRIENTLYINEPELEKEQIKQIKSLNLVGELNASNIENAKNITKTKEMLESASGAKITSNVKQLSTTEINENIDIKTILYTNGEKFNLFKNPKIKITFPKEVTDVNLNNVSLLYEDELKIDTYEKKKENGQIVIYISLAGEQTKHVNSEIIKGANIIVNCSIMCDKDTKDISGQINMEFENEGETNYYNEAKSTLDIKYIIPEPVENENTQEENNVDEPTTLEGNTNTSETPIQNTEAQDSQVQEANINITKQLKTGDNTEIYERQVYEYLITIKNNGNEELKNITLKDTVPNELNYVTEILDQGYQNDFEEKVDTRDLSKEIESLAAGESQSFSYKFVVNKAEENVGKTVGTKASVVINDKTYESNLPQNTIKENNLQLWQVTESSRTFDYDDMGIIEYIAKIKNCSSSDMKDIQVKDYIPEELDYVSSCILKKDENWYADETSEEGTYDEKENLVTWIIDSLPVNGEIGVKVTFSTKKMDVDKEKISIENQFIATENEKEIKSNIVGISQKNRLNVGIQLSSTLQDTYVKENEEFEYIITVSNYDKENDVSVELEDKLPEGLNGKELTIETDGKQEVYGIGENIWTNASIPASTSVKFYIKVVTKELEDGKDSLEIRNKATVSGLNINSVESNELVNIIKIDANKDNNNQNNGNQDNGNQNSGNQNNNGSQNDGNQENITGKISGIAWLDTNENGQRDSEEKYIENVKVNLLYAENGEYVKDKNGNVLEQKTNKQGKYEFSGLENNKYMLVFEYDNSKYELTDYQKNGVSEELNSDTTLYELSEDKNVGITNTIEINSNSKENIDIGLTEKKIFDLKLDKYVSKITVKNTQETKTYTLDNSKLAKVELKSKYVDGTEIEIEYKIVVTNEGQIDGYAKQIIDYIPEGYSFNPNANAGWQVINGNLLYQGLKDTKIGVGNSKTISLKLTRTLDKKSLGMVTNVAEIYEDYNSLGIDDKDSKPNNKNNSEDDFSSASVIVSISTGKIIRYSIIFVLSLAIIVIGVFIIKKEVIDKA